MNTGEGITDTATYNMYLSLGAEGRERFLAYSELLWDSVKVGSEFCAKSQSPKIECS